VQSADDWGGASLDDLRRYNLHYFDDLNAEDAERRSQWHASLIERWIDENPPAKGVGWDPYPTSLRIVNWIKWALCGNPLSIHALESLKLQTDYLSKRIEWHLLGNHLFANAKALVFSGLFFSGEVAERWLDTGFSIIDRQVSEQILADGGHFERSPMYHSIILEDVLDLLNITQAYVLLHCPTDSCKRFLCQHLSLRAPIALA